MPGYMAWLYVYGQAVKAAVAESRFNRWNEEDFRSTYYDQFVIGADEVVQLVTVEPEIELEVVSTVGKTKEPEAPKRGNPTETH